MNIVKRIGSSEKIPAMNMREIRFNVNSLEADLKLWNKVADLRLLAMICH